MTDPTSSGPSAEVRLLADEFLARGDGGELSPPPKQQPKQPKPKGNVA